MLDSIPVSSSRSWISDSFSASQWQKKKSSLPRQCWSTRARCPVSLSKNCRSVKTVSGLLDFSHASSEENVCVHIKCFLIIVSFSNQPDISSVRSNIWLITIIGEEHLILFQKDHRRLMFFNSIYQFRASLFLYIALKYECTNFNWGSWSVLLVRDKV